MRHYASVVSAMALSPSIRHNPVLYWNDWTDWALFSVETTLGLSYTDMREFGYRQKLRVFPSGTQSQTPDFKKILPQHIDVNLVRPIAITNLSHWVSNTISMTKHAVLVHLLQMRLKLSLLKR